MKNNQGVTVVQLAILIVVMLVIISISVFESPDTARKADITKRFIEITTVQDAIKERDAIEDVRIDETRKIMTILGENNSSIEISLTEGTTESFMNSEELYGYLDFKNNSNLARILEVENVENNYYVRVADLSVYLEQGHTLPDGITVFSVPEFQKYSENSFVK